MSSSESHSQLVAARRERLYEAVARMGSITVADLYSAVPAEQLVRWVCPLNPAAVVSEDTERCYSWANVTAHTHARIDMVRRPVTEATLRNDLNVLVKAGRLTKQMVDGRAYYTATADSRIDAYTRGKEIEQLEAMWEL